ncbi:5-formyltetrahydrofolate cyclo-ligase [Blattella germanica]|nr:5-formyltetrahydrofolate cyclo-ligase [Blattella germanica]
MKKKFLRSKEYQSSKRISVFLSMDDEIQTDKIVRDIFDTERTCFIPRYSSNGSQMEMVRLYSLQDLEDLPTTKWNIKQPLETDDRENALETGGLDLIVVPGMAFSTDGKRMGRGKGYYDAYLGRCRASQTTPPLTVALAFSQQIVDHVPTDEHDIKIDLVLFPPQHRK